MLGVASHSEEGHSLTVGVAQLLGDGYGDIGSHTVGVNVPALDLGALPSRVSPNVKEYVNKNCKNHYDTPLSISV